MARRHSQAATALLPPLFCLLFLFFFCSSSIARAQPQPQQPQQPQQMLEPQQQQQQQPQRMPEPQPQPQQQQPQQTPPPPPQQQPRQTPLEPFDSVAVVDCPLTIVLTPVEGAARSSLVVSASSDAVARAVVATVDGGELRVGCTNASFSSADPIKINITFPASSKLRKVASQGGAVVLQRAVGAPAAAPAPVPEPSPAPAPAPVTAPVPASALAPNAAPNTARVVQAQSNANNSNDSENDNSAPLVLVASGLGASVHVRALPPNTKAVAIAAEGGATVVVRDAQALDEVDVVAADTSAVLVSGASGRVRVGLKDMSRVFVTPASSSSSAASGRGNRTLNGPVRIDGGCSFLARVFVAAPSKQQDSEDSDASDAALAACSAQSSGIEVGVWPWFSGKFIGAQSCCSPAPLSQEPAFAEPRWSCGVEFDAPSGDEVGGGGGDCTRHEVSTTDGDGRESGFVSVSVSSVAAGPQHHHHEVGRRRNGNGPVQCASVVSRQSLCSASKDELRVAA